jgi:hypothetical protein
VFFLLVLHIVGVARDAAAEAVRAFRKGRDLIRGI